MIKLTLLSLTLFLTSCAHTKVNKYKNFDESEKTISIPLKDGVEFIAEVKDYFRQNGFKVISFTGKNHSSYNFSNQNTARYDMNFTTTPTELFTLCLFGRELSYWISITDTKDGQEVFSMSGASCSSRIMRKLKKRLKLRK